MRSAAQARAVAGVTGGDPALVVNQGGAGPVSAEWMLPKSLWLAQCEPATWARAATICEYQARAHVVLGERWGCCSAGSVHSRCRPWAMLFDVSTWSLPSHSPPTPVNPPRAHRTT